VRTAQVQEQSCNYNTLLQGDSRSLSAIKSCGFLYSMGQLWVSELIPRE
jgi:hypothetical protein